MHRCIDRSIDRDGARGSERNGTDGLTFQFFQFLGDRRRRDDDDDATRRATTTGETIESRVDLTRLASRRLDSHRLEPHRARRRRDAKRMGDDEGTRARGVGGRCRSILRAASDALTRCETRLNEVNEKYTFELCPEYRLKVNKTIGTTRVGMTFDARERRYRVAVKRAGSMKGEDESEREDDVPLFWRAMNKLVLDPEEKRIELYSRRVDYGPLSLRGVGEYNATDGEWGLRWQLQTFQKEKKRLRSAEYELNDRVRGCLRWDVQSVAPEVEGAVGSKEKFSFDVDVGSYHVTVPRLEMKVDL
jgi:hypothetical protein